MPRYVRVRDVDKQGEVDSYWLPEAEVVASGGSGDVSGPASATADHLAVFDGITGKLIKDGGAVSAVPVKASGAEVDTGTDDAKFTTAKALADSAYAKTTDITATAVGLANADNTSDVNKPVSSATQTALDLKANDAGVVHDTGDETVAGVKTFSSDPIIPDEAYGVGWNGSLEPPTKNAVYDKIETLGAAGIGGDTGVTDNAILRADGVGGATAQGSNLTVGDDGAAIAVSAVGAATNIGITHTPKGSGDFTVRTTKIDSNSNFFVGGGAVVAVPSTLDFYYNNAATLGARIGANGLLLSTALDAGIARAAAGVVESNSGIAGTLRDFKAREFIADATVTAAGTTGAQTINKSAGSVNFAASATSLVVTNSLVTANSIIIATVMTNDATLKSVQCVAAAGSFTMFADAAATAETRVAFWITN